mgnify:CR=1 FL=1
MTLAHDTQQGWVQFLEYVKNRCSTTAYENWITPIKIIEASSEFIKLEVPNIFVKEYLLSNYKKDLAAFLPVNKDGEPLILFVIAPPEKKTLVDASKINPSTPSLEKPPVKSAYQNDLNPSYRFENFIEGPNNQFVKSAAIGIANKPGESYNPLFIYGGVGLGKTHILHSIGHHIRETHKKLKIQCITTEQFINDLTLANNSLIVFSKQKLLPNKSKKIN